MLWACHAPHTTIRERYCSPSSAFPPQILTETVYALAVTARPAFIPDEVHVITTAEGAEYVRHTLLDSGMGRFSELLHDFGLAGRVQFHIH